MRNRIVAIMAMAAMIFALIGYSVGTPQTLAQDSTPESDSTNGIAEASPTVLAESTTVAVEESAATPLAETPASPVAEPVRVVTLVGWYQADSSGDFLEIGPLQTTDQLVAGPGDPTSSLTGRADLDSPDNNELPRITLGETILDGVELITGNPDTIFNWVYYEGDPGLRPATLVIAVVATAGPYEGRSGTVIFLSRSSPGSGVFAALLNPLEG